MESAAVPVSQSSAVSVRVPVHSLDHCVTWMRNEANRKADKMALQPNLMLLGESSASRQLRCFPTTS
jgi:hypothetical protein